MNYFAVVGQQKSTGCYLGDSPMGVRLDFLHTYMKVTQHHTMATADKAPTTNPAINNSMRSEIISGQLASSKSRQSR